MRHDCVWPGAVLERGASERSAHIVAARKVVRYIKYDTDTIHISCTNTRMIVTCEFKSTLNTFFC